MFADQSFPACIPPSTTRRGMMRGGAAALASIFADGPSLAQDASRWPSVARFVSDAVNAEKVAGMVAALGWHQAPPDYITAGHRTFAGDSRVGSDTLWRIYSMTKPITGVATIMCIDDGLLALDQPLAEILPAFASMQVQKTYDGGIAKDDLEPAIRPITIRHLLTHTAGLGYTIVQEGPIREAYIRSGLTPAVFSRLELAAEIAGKPPAFDLATFADRLATMPLVEQPGTRWRYSVALDLLVHVIELVTEQDFASFLKKRLFAPCGMNSTYFQVPRSETGRLAGNYFVLAGLPLPIDPPASSVFLEQPPFAFGGSGLVSSAHDYDRFLQMLAGRGAIEGRQVMSEAAVALATSDLYPDTAAPGSGFGDGEFGYGAGGLVGKGDRAGTFGWFGAAGTVGLVNIPMGLRMTLMTQYMPAETYPWQTRFPEIVAHDALLQAPSVRPAT